MFNVFTVIICALLGSQSLTLVSAATQEEAAKKLEEMSWYTEEYPPYNFASEDGTPTGITVDILLAAFKKMNVKIIKHSPLLNKKIKKVAVLGGSGSFAIEDALNNGADCLVTADLKYHDYFKAENKILLVDIGHYESEQYTKDLILNLLNKKIPKFACIISKSNTNPVNYF